MTSDCKPKTTWKRITSAIFPDLKTGEGMTKTTGKRVVAWTIETPVPTLGEPLYLIADEHGYHFEETPPEDQGGDAGGNTGFASRYDYDEFGRDWLAQAEDEYDTWPNRPARGSGAMAAIGRCLGFVLVVLLVLLVVTQLEKRLHPKPEPIPIPSSSLTEKGTFDVY
jgi:hypothetical protein